MDKPIKLSPRYFAPEKGKEKLLADWPIFDGIRWSKYVPTAICKDRNCGRCIGCASGEDNAIEIEREKENQ